jgi:hypothetical protein
MAQHIKYLVGLVAALLAILLPFSALAQSFSVSPAEVSIDNLAPGEGAEFNLTIHNKGNSSHTFILTSYSPEESQLRQGRAEFPDESWISFSPQRIEVAANSNAEVKVTVSIPSDSKWAGKDWEVWLGVNSESSDLLTVKLYVRLLVSTSEEAGGSSNIWLIAVLAIAIILLGYGVYYSRHKTRSK